MATLLLVLVSGLVAEGMEPAFRLPIAGRPLCPLVIDAASSPVSVWALSEDQRLYLLSEEGRLLARTALPDRPRPFLALDGGGRALVVLDPPGEEPVLVSFTRLGREAFRVSLSCLSLGEAEVPALVRGADDRLFVASRSRVLCLAQSGQRLWTYTPAPGLADPRGADALGVDGLGRPVLSLSDGQVLVLSPYGEVEARIVPGGRVARIAAFVPGAYRAGTGDRAPVLALGLASGEVLLLDRRGAVLSRLAGQSPVQALGSGGEVLYVLAANGGLGAYTAAGALRWRTETGVAGGSLSVHGSRLVLTATGRATSLDLSGRILREATLANAAGPGVVSAKGLLFSPGADWVLGAFPFEAVLGPQLATALEPYGDDEADLVALLTFDPGIGGSGHRLALLADYEAALDAGELGPLEPKAGALAAAMVRGAFTPPYSAAEARFRAELLPKARALALLGRLGSPERLPVVVDAFLAEADPSLRAAACGAIGDLGRDPEGLAGGAFAQAATRQGMDDQVAFALVGAVETLALRSGNPPGMEALRALLALTRPPHGQDVRNAATRALSRLAGSIGP